MKTKLNWCDRGLFKSPYYYAVCISERDYLREMKRLRVEHYEPWLITPQADATVHYFKCEGKFTSIICLGDTTKRSLVEIVGLLTHEATHLWRAIKEHVGEREPSTEFEAYAMQTLTQELIASWAAQDKRGRKLMRHPK